MLILHTRFNYFLTRAMMIRRILLAVALAGIVLPLGAQESRSMVDDGAVLSLEQCRELALSNNRNLRKISQQVLAAGYQKEEAFAAYLPSIDFAGGYMYNQKNLSLLEKDALLPVKTFDIQKQGYEFGFVKNPVTGEPVIVDGKPVPEQVALLPKEAMTFDIHNVFFGAVTLTQPVFMGGKIMAMNKITGYAEELARAKHGSASRDLVYAVDAAYWQVVSLKAKKKLAESYVNLLDTLCRNVGLMVEQGVATRRDKLTVDVKLNSARVDLTKVNNGLVLSRMALAQLCGFPIHTSYSLADENADRLVSGTSQIPAESYDMNEVYARRDDLRQLELGVKIFGQKEKVARAAMMPNLAIVGTYSFSNPSSFDGFKNRFGGAFSVGAMLTVPIWHWGGNYNKYRSAKAETAAMRMELEDAREMIDLQVSQASFKAEEAARTHEMTEANLASADENLRCADIGFRDGVMTVDNVMEAQTAWLKAHSENIDARIDVYLCDVYLSKVLGTLSTKY